MEISQIDEPDEQLVKKMSRNQRIEHSITCQGDDGKAMKKYRNFAEKMAKSRFSGENLGSASRRPGANPTPELPTECKYVLTNAAENNPKKMPKKIDENAKEISNNSTPEIEANSMKKMAEIGENSIEIMAELAENPLKLSPESEEIYPRMPGEILQVPSRIFQVPSHILQEPSKNSSKAKPTLSKLKQFLGKSKPKHYRKDHGGWSLQDVHPRDPAPPKNLKTLGSKRNKSRMIPRAFEPAISTATALKNSTTPNKSAVVECERKPANSTAAGRDWSLQDVQSQEISTLWASGKPPKNPSQPALKDYYTE